MAADNTAAPAHSFMAGGGEMGERTRQYDWAPTAIGLPDGWPQPLCTILSVILHAKSPMFLWWGPNLIQFYNDAYRPSLGESGKHPTALGQRGADCWPETWSLIYPQIEQVLGGGKATWNENQLVPIFRNGRLENVYWTYGYSPVLDEAGQVAGVLVVCQETTQTINKSTDDREQLQFALEAARFGVWELDPATYMIHWDDRCAALFGLVNAPQIPYEQALPYVHPDDALRVDTTIRGTLNAASGGYFDLTYRTIGATDGRLRWVRFTGRSYVGTAGRVNRFSGVAHDVTQEAQARQQLANSDRHFRELFERAPVGIAILRGPEQIFEMVNPVYIHLVGRATVGDLLGKPMLVALPELADQGFDRLLHTVMQTGEAFTANERRADLLRNGQLETCYFNFVYEPLRDGLTGRSPADTDPSTGAVSGVFVLATEVTQQVLARQAVEANAAYLQRVFRSAAVGMAIFRGPTFIIEVANPNVCAIWGRTEAQVLGRPLFEALPEAAGQGFEELLTEVMRTGNPFIGSELPATIIRDGKPETVYFDFVYDALPDADGATNRVLVTASDASERKRARQQTDQLLVRERELNELKSNFVTLASHEFRTPMGTILSSASLIGRYNGPDDDDKRERHVQWIKSAVHGLTGLLNDFLSLSQMEQSTLHGNPLPLNIVLFCDEVVEDIHGIIKPGQRVTYRHVAGDPLIVIDGQMLKNILINLLVNASKYSADEKLIDMTTTVRGNQLLVTVKDEGIGIPDLDKDKLFISFFRARNATHVQGTGLGLYVVKRYVDLLGGTVTFSSQVDSGTVFTVQLPLTPLPV